MGKCSKLRQKILTGSADVNAGHALMRMDVVPLPDKGALSEAPIVLPRFDL